MAAELTDPLTAPPELTDPPTDLPELTDPFLQEHTIYIREQQPVLVKEFFETTKHNIKFIDAMNFLRIPSPKTYKNMRKHFKNEDDMFEYVDQLNDVILKAPPTPEKKLYRGMDVDLKDNDGVITMGGMNSTSLKIDVAAKFAGGKNGCIYELVMPEKTPFLYLGNIADITKEYEVMIPLHCSFQVVSTEMRTEGDEVYKVKTCKYIGHLNSAKEIDISNKSNITILLVTSYIIPLIEQLSNLHKKFKLSETIRKTEYYELLDKQASTYGTTRNELLLFMRNHNLIPPILSDLGISELEGQAEDRANVGGRKRTLKKFKF